MYRNILYLLPLFFFAIHCNAQEELQTDIDSLTLYLNGAAVHRSATVDLEKGKNELRFKGLSPKLRSGSIRLSLSAPEKARILSVSDHTDLMATPSHRKKVEGLKDELEQSEIRMDSLTDLKNAYQEEKRMLLANQDIGGEGSNLSSTGMRQMADFFRQRVQEINRSSSSIDRAIQKVQEKRRKLRQQLREMNARGDHRRSEVELLIMADAGMKLELGLDYRVDGAGWAPFYDIRAKGVDRPVHLDYRAKVFNNTNVDWENVRFTLSTGDSDRDVSKPDLEKWSLSYYGGGKGGSSGSGNFKRKSAPQKQVKGQDKARNKKSGQDGSPRFKTVQVSELSPDFRIEESYSVPSNAKPYMVEVTEYELPATYKHYAIPKLEESVYLLAGVTDWENLGLIEGKANVYFDGNYKGSSYLRPRGLGDTLNISLGRDKKIFVDRKLMKEYTSSQFIGSKRKDELSYRIRVKNNREDPIDIEIIDQYPISTVESIEVKLDEISGAERNTSTGQLTWKFRLEGGAKQSIELSYEIEYPKGHQIQRQQYQEMSAPSF